MKTRIAFYRGRKSQNDHALIGDLFDWAVQQPGARVVPDEELRTPWSAHT